MSGTRRRSLLRAALIAAPGVEGLVIVQGDADFTKSPGGTFNVGWVGVGSGVVPTPGEVMLAVGGDLSVGAGTVLDVGANARDASDELLGGNVDVGGITTPDYETDGSRYRLNNGALQQELGAAATAPWSTWGGRSRWAGGCSSEEPWSCSSPWCVAGDPECEP
ncbi:hypothetical protein [Microbacterium trichothecenolyticum]|uniref:Uncharacterized protein n=1 Tax=Microbacterium trichothecenolyticum TaxID=69370 RepID=A0A0M2H879_MICTR|nr:hypothetical protein [Microbacterium trichothecenolyticum]KJL40791.1 hypothetical protein RS82_03407 [Microbacterium trichothecenolyticum]